MTVHGAKGLEAPIVFLPDTCSTRSGRRPGGLLRLDVGDAASRDRRRRSCGRSRARARSRPCSRQGRDAERREAEERNRLLYVALTRARDRLYVAGFESAQGAPSPDCWYRLIRDGLNGELQEVAGRDGRPVWRLETQADRQAESPARAPLGCGRRVPLPDWAKRRRRRSRCSPMPLSPVAPGAARDRRGGRSRGRAAPPLCGAADRSPRRRWRTRAASCAARSPMPCWSICRRCRSERWTAAAERSSRRAATRCRAAMRKAIVTETLAVLREPAFAALFGPDSRAEVAIAAEVPRPAARARRCG